MAKRGRPLSSDWVDTPTAICKLNISRDHLTKLKTDGTLKEGIHWRDIRSKNATRARYRWHYPRIDQLLSIPPEKRG